MRITESKLRNIVRRMISEMSSSGGSYASRLLKPTTKMRVVFPVGFAGIDPDEMRTEREAVETACQDFGLSLSKMSMSDWDASPVFAAQGSILGLLKLQRWFSSRYGSDDYGPSIEGPSLDEIEQPFSILSAMKIPLNSRRAEEIFEKFGIDLQQILDVIDEKFEPAIPGNPPPEGY